MGQMKIMQYVNFVHARPPYLITVTLSTVSNDFTMFNDSSKRDIGIFIQ